MDDVIMVPRSAWCAAKELSKRVDKVLEISPEDNASNSRDFGRGFNLALKLVHDALDGK